MERGIRPQSNSERPDVGLDRSDGLAASRAHVLAEAGRLAHHARYQLAGTQDAMRGAIWLDKASRARAGEVAFFEAEAQARGITAEALIALVIARADAFAHAAALIDTREAEIKMLVAGAVDQADLDAIVLDLDKGWVR